MSPSTSSTGAVNPSSAAAVVEAVERLAVVEKFAIEPDARFVVVPAGKKIESLKPLIDQFRETPERRRGTATFRDVASFAAHIARFGTERTVVFAEPSESAPAITALYDYHPAGGDTAKADWLQHRAKYAPPLADEWKAWHQINGRSMPQPEFAAMLEDRITDVVLADAEDPTLKAFAEAVGGVNFASPSTLVALSRGLALNVDTKVRDAVTLSSGEIAVTYEEVHTDGTGQPLKVPNVFVIAVPVFYAGPRYRIPVRLRYRIVGGRLAWSCHLHRPDLVFQDAFDEAVKFVRDQTAAPVFIGTPESA